MFMSPRVPRAPAWLLGYVAVLGALVAYCELCTIVNGLPPPGLDVSGAWALQVSSGWIVVGAAIGAFGSRLTTSPWATRFGCL